jgi:hypothetical protein
MRGLQMNLLLVLCVIMFSFGQGEDGSSQLSTEELIKDVHELRSSLEKNHPGLYWYTSKEQFKLAWDSLDTSIDSPMTEDQFLKLILPVVAKVQCAHTLFYP